MVVGEFTEEIDLAVIGGGPGGYTAGFRAADLGASTILIDPRDGLGGVCLHEGCVPSKTLLYATEVLHLVQRAQGFGIRYEPPTIEVDQLRGWTQQTIGKLSRMLDKLADKAGVERVQGVARFEDGKHLVVPGPSTRRIKFKRAVIATGSAAIEHPALSFDGTRILRPNEATRLERIPGTLLVVGSGYIAVELACIYATLGSRVSMLTADERLLPEADRDLARPLERRLAELLDAITVGTEIESAVVEEDGVRVACAGPEAPPSITADMVVVAIGQRANIDDLDPAKAGVTLDADGWVAVDNQLRTSEPRILAVGDVTGHPLLADRAIHQGRIAAEVVAGWGSTFEARAVPMVVFTDPQIAWCGLTELEAERENIAYGVKKIPWSSSGRAVGMGRSEGLTKIIFDPDVKIVLGAGLAGPHAGEMIAEAALAIEMGAELTDLAQTVHPHPTMSELLSDVARSADEAESADEKLEGLV